MAKDTKKGLGTGLSALFGEDFLSDGDDAELLYVPLSKVEPRADQPRSCFDDAALSELADSIAQYGLIQPITVRKLQSGYYQIIAGERRWRASRMAGLDEVPVRVISADDRRVAELALVENLQREDLNPIEEAQGYKTLMDEYGLTQEEAARSVGKSRPAITNTLRLLSLGSDVRKLVEQGLLSSGHARTLLPVQDEKLQLELAKKVITDGLSVRKTEQLVSRTLKSLMREPEEPVDPGFTVDYIADTSEQLTKLLSRKVSLDVNKKGGRIVLEFYGSDDREALISNLVRMGKSWTSENGK